MFLFLGPAAHVLLSGAVAGAFAVAFGRSWHPVAGHVVLVAGWDLVLLGLLGSSVVLMPGRGRRWTRLACAVLPALTMATQIYLYTLNLVSNLSWGRNISGHLVASFTPTVWSGREPFPVGRVGITACVLGTLVAMLWASRWWAGPLDAALRRTLRSEVGARLVRVRAAVGVAAALVIAVATFGAGVARAVASDELPWKTEFVASFLRPDALAFEPTTRRQAVADEDAVLRASYPAAVPGARRKHVILVIVDSLRADRMQVYGYGRPTTPFLSRLVESGRMHKVAQAFATCPESFCGITSTLSSRTFRDLTPSMFQVQDVLRAQGYTTWFLLSGNHEAWNGLPRFYHAEPGTFFDGSMTERYSMDDDRLVLEGLERVPAAAPGQPAFFYVHLMSPHYLGVQLPGSHRFTRPDDDVRPGLEPYKLLARLNKPDRYDDKVRQVDGLIEQLFAAFGAKGYLDEAIVVVTGDHGEGLGERHWAHGWDLYNEDIRIPLLLYDEPAARSGEPAAHYGNLAFASQVDIAPTILDRLGLPVPASWEGRSLVDAAARPFSVHQTYFRPNRFAVLRPEGTSLYKYIATPAYGTEELYNLAADPGETRSVLAEHPALAVELRERVRAYRADEPY